MDAALQDERFSFIAKDPRFKPIPHKERKIKIDKRFEGMFKDKKFKLKYTMDKYGRPMQHNTTEDLKKFYELTSSESDAENEFEEKGNEKLVNNKKGSQKSEIFASETSSNITVYKTQSESMTKIKSNKLKGKKMEHEQNIKNTEKSSCQMQDSEGDSESSTSIDTDSEDDNSDSFDHKWGELDVDAPRAAEITNRIAVCNMDWDRIQAKDLLVLFNSFKPPEGVIESVKIYPSEFGLQRMKEEEMHGPAELVEKKIEDNEEVQVDDEDKSSYHVEKLRKYQLNRLKYYYAVVECDSPQTANTLYENLDRMEYECSSACLDLRFIPEDMTFDHEPSSVADALLDMSVYKPSVFITSALQQAKVHLTWDETDPRRTEIIQHAFNDAEKAETDLQTYLASSSSSESEGPPEDDNESVPEGKLKDQINKYKQLLQSIEEEEKKKHEDDVEMEVTWEPGLKEKAQELVKAKQRKEDSLTPWEQYLEKKKKKRKIKQKDKKLKAKEISDSDLEDEVEKDSDSNQESSENDSDGPKHKSTKKKRKGHTNRDSPTKTNAQLAELELMMAEGTNKPIEVREMKKEKRKKEKRKKTKTDGLRMDDFEVNVKDPRFSAIFTSHNYNIDPSDPHYKFTKGTQKIIQEKQRMLNFHNA